MLCHRSVRTSIVNPDGVITPYNGCLFYTQGWPRKDLPAEGGYPLERPPYPKSNLAHMTCPANPRYVKMLVTYNMLQDDRSYILFVQERDGQWSWPGGKVESQDKDANHAASRELLEEAGMAVGAQDWRRIGNEEHAVHGTCAAFAYTLTGRNLPPLKSLPDPAGTVGPFV